MKKQTFFIILILAAVSLFCPAAFAWSRDVNGKPTYTAGKNFGVYIWHLSKAWHVRTTAKKGAQVFSGIIKGDGKLTIKTNTPLKGGDYVYLSDQKTIKFRFTTVKQEDGFDFTTTGNVLTFELQLNGKKAPKDLINLGMGRNHPNTNPVTIKR
jgi:hypothetical protein